MILLIDFGSQTTHLIARRVRELGSEVEIATPEVAVQKIRAEEIQGIILSGGPAAVFEKQSPTVNPEIFELGIPVLGICYGQQLMCHLLGGEVVAGRKREYGPAVVRQQATGDKRSLRPSGLRPQFLEGIPDEFTAWMSHGDQVIKIPEGFVTYGTTETIPHAIIANEKRKFYGIQFHPEVVHTEFGEQILKNFLEICGIKIKKQEIDGEFVENLIKNIRDSLGEEKAICALSGGVDSSVVALLVHKAIGKNLTSVYVDSGLMREGETETLRSVFQQHYKMNVDIVDAKKEFLKALKKVVDPEQKRKAIGKTFIEVFDNVAKKIYAKFLVQGTIYPDVIESAGSKHSQKIKSHHNVGGLPEEMNLILIEPLRNFYKDEVRKIGRILGLPDEIIERQPFPGPALAVRIIGEVTEEKLEILRKADKIVLEEIEKAGLGKKLWQYFAVFTGIKTTGVRGDQRFYGETIAIRAIEATDAMSASFAKLPYDLLDKISTRIVNEVPEVNRVVYDITNKPPATMEWE
ncbi:glutamine-hydrolyzing GMP synthase [Candidatus Daviesbacteria bacterium]|nr:glutamine-hydrolyzing GMP synthase [Candidatus Daviesbacteria bacterium]